MAAPNSQTMFLQNTSNRLIPQYLSIYAEEDAKLRYRAWESALQNSIKKIYNNGGFQTHLKQVFQLDKSKEKTVLRRIHSQMLSTISKQIQLSTNDADCCPFDKRVFDYLINKIHNGGVNQQIQRILLQYSPMISGFICKFIHFFYVIQKMFPQGELIWNSCHDYRCETTVNQIKQIFHPSLLCQLNKIFNNKVYPQKYHKDLQNISDFCILSAQEYVTKQQNQIKAKMKSISYGFITDQSSLGKNSQLNSLQSLEQSQIVNKSQNENIIKKKKRKGKGNSKTTKIQQKIDQLNCTNQSESIVKNLKIVSRKDRAQQKCLIQQKAHFSKLFTNFSVKKKGRSTCYCDDSWLTQIHHQFID